VAGSDFRSRRFRTHSVKMGVLISLSALLLHLAWAGARSRPADLSAPWSALIVGLSFAVSALVVLLFPIHVGRDGLRAYDGIGRYHDVRWEEIEKASHPLGFYWVRHGRPGKALCFPVFMEDDEWFRRSVIALAPPGNPLRTLVESRST
jgi:hypothetical protein